MSSTVSETAAPRAEAQAGSEPAFDWNLVLRQLTGVLRLELRRNLLSRRSFIMFFLAGAPLVLFFLWDLLSIPQQNFSGPTEVTPLFAAAFEGYLRTSVFLSTLIVFMSLFRAEILERSLHYYFLTPVRREVLTAGKYLAALLSTGIVFAAGTAVLFFLTFIPWGLGEFGRYLQGPGLGNLLGYLGVALLGCAGYGAIFMMLGQFFRNTVVAAVVVWGWEAINFILPPLLKKFSVIFYLQSLYPVPLPQAMITVVADPVPAWLSVPGLMLFTGAVLAVAGWRARRMEVSYDSD